MGAAPVTSTNSCAKTRSAALRGPRTVLVTYFFRRVTGSMPE